VLEQELADLKAALTPVFVVAPLPRDYDAKALDSILHERLTREEQDLLVRPLATTTELDSRARELAAAGTNDLGKARLVFDALAGHLDAGQSELRTAAQVFTAWNGPESSFTCQEYALLYTVMARAVGLRAYVASVSRDHTGQHVSHACSAVVSGDRLLLVDPSYRWFGVPHKEFSVMNDLETAADYLSQRGELRLRQIAVKLQPDSIYAQFKLGVRYAVEEQWPQAREQLAILERLAPNGCHTCCLKAMIAYQDKKLDETVDFGHKALDRGWPAHDGFVHFILGRAYYDQLRFGEAREAFRTVVRRASDEKLAKVARRCIARINEIVGDD
jgi:tetratricopeptide (TPR) repeat protein